MPKIKVSGIGDLPAFEIDAKGFAEEETLQKLVTALTGKAVQETKKAKDVSKNMNATADAADVLQEAFIDLTEDVDDAKMDLSKFSKAAKGAVNAFDSAIDKMSDFSGASADGTINLQSVVSTVSDLGTKALDAVGDVVKGIPLVGEAIAGLTTGLGVASLQIGSAVSGFVIGQLQGLRDQQRQLFDSGVYFSAGIDDAAEQASAAGITIGVMSKAAAESKESLRLFAGGAAAGLRKVTGAFGKISGEEQKLLYAYGYTNDEILSGMADFGATAAMLGKDLSIDELAAASMGYLTNLKDLSRISGKNVKDAEAQVEANRRSLAFQTYLGKLADPKVATGIEKFIANLSPDAAELVKARLMGYTITDPRLAAMQAQVPGLLDAIDVVRAGVDSGKLTVDTMDDYFGQMQINMKSSVDQFVTNLAGDNQAFLAQIEKSPGIMGEIITALGSVRYEAIQAKNAAEAGAETLDPKKIADDNAKLAAAIAKLTKLETDMASKFQSAATNMTDVASDYVGALDSIMELTKKALGAPENIESMDADSKVQSLLEDMQGNWWDKTKESFNVDGSEKDPYAALTAQQLEAAGLKRSTRPAGAGRGGAAVVTYEKNMALGGPVKKDNPYLVGETGPEKFIPKQSGIIQPLKAVPVEFDSKSFDEIAGMLKSLVNGIGESTLGMEEVGANIADQIVSKASEYFAAQEPIANKPEREESVAAVPTQVKVDLPGLGEMNQRLDSLIKLNSAMLDAMNKGNSIDRQAMLFAR